MTINMDKAKEYVRHLSKHSIVGNHIKNYINEEGNVGRASTF